MWKKIIFKAVTMLLIFMGLGSYGAYLSGQPIPIFNSKNLASIKSSLNNVLESVKPDNIAKTTKTVVEGEPEKLFFKWTSPSGQTQFGDTPAADAQNIEVIRGKDLRGNVVAATKIPEPEPEEERQADNTGSSMSNPYSPEGVKEIMQKARDVEKLMQDRAAQQEKMMGEL